MLASAGTSVKFWNLEDYSFIQEISYSKSDNTSSLSWNKDGQFLIALQKNSSEIPLYAVSSKSAGCVNIFKVINQPKSLQFANTALRYLAIAGAKDTVLVWDIKSNNKKKAFKVPVKNASLTHLSFNTSDSHLTVGSTSGEAFLLSNTNNLVTGPINLFKDITPVTDIQFSLNNPSIVGASGENGCVSIMDVNSKTVLKEFSNAHSAPVSGLCFSPINELLMVTVGYDKKFVSYNVNAKREIISHTSTAPLTSVCFVGNGQYIALGTMVGSIIIHDLRMLKSSVANLSAYEGSVSSLKLQPLSKNLSIKTNKVVPKNAEKKIERNSSRSEKENEKAHIKTPVASTTVSSGITPTLNLLSPINLCKNEEVVQQTGYGQRTPIKLFKKCSGFDDLGILSPIDKENQSPAPGIEFANWKNTRSNEEAKAIDDLFSPLHETPHDRILNTSVQSQLESRKYDDLMDECLSPVGKKLALNSESDSTSKYPVSFSEILLPLSEKDRRHLQKATRDLMKETMSFEPSCTMEHFEESKRTSSPSVLKKTSEEGHLTTGSGPAPSVTPISQRSLTRPDKEMSSLKPFSNLAAVEDSKKESTSKPLSNAEFTEIDSKLEKDSRVRFEASNICQASEPEKEESSNIAAASSNMNLELIQNCFEDTLESFQFDVNKRFMHVQYLMTKQFLTLQKEMRNLFRENSLNEEILLENERLREEIKRLKSTY